MSAFSLNSPVKALLMGSAALSLAACGSSGSYRVASVGSVPESGTAGAGSDGAGGGDGASGSTAVAGSAGASGTNGAGGAAGMNGSTGTNGTAGTNGGAGANGTAGTNGQSRNVASRVLVSAGNTVIGVSGKHNELAESINGLAPGTTKITGTVTTVLRKSGQSLVDLGNGQSLILNGAGGKLGEVVKIDLASRTVTGAASGSPLLGVSVLSPNVATGSVAAANVGNSGPVLAIGNGSSASGALAPVTGVVSGATGSTAVSGVAGVTGAAGVTGVTGVTGVAGVTGVTGVTGVVPGVGATPTTHATNVVGGVLGGLKGKPH